MFKHNPERTSNPALPALSVSSNSITWMIANEEVGTDITTKMSVENRGPGTLNWNASQDFFAMTHTPKNFKRRQRE